MNAVAQINDATARVQSAASLTELLVAGWEAFTVLLETCHACAEQAPSMFAAVSFAAAAASRGRILLASAPSFPMSQRMQAGHSTGVQAEIDKATADLAVLANSLYQRLWQAAGETTDAGDREACLEAAAHAAQVAELLSQDR